MGYKLKIRTTAPSNTDKHWIHYTANGYNTACIIDDKTKSCIPNCVGYNMGRIAECLRAISQAIFEKWKWKIPVCNAEDCYEEAKKNGLKVGSTPKIGASIVWRKGKTHNESDGCGHIMFIEGLYMNGDILVSGSNYNGTRFYTKRITKASGYYFANGYTLVGFIYFPVTYDVEYLDKTDNKTTNLNTSKTPGTSTTSTDYKNSKIPNRFKVLQNGKQVGAYTYYDGAVTEANKVKGSIKDGKTGKIIYNATTTVSNTTATTTTRPTLNAKSYPNYTGNKFYKVQKKFNDWSNSIGAYSLWANAYDAWIKNKNKGYHVYNNEGKQLD